ncbi:GNAT family N-acetyltransferase [Nonomuraea africana]|uniref:RimJ/RimL family protein N-acetyltransferase n=1 Tax=Nonomuraea africana TaxID=46171 RepID=A0ABR9KJ12_9ACTN|nr:GNAT family protein [Nonomuraea africana]MBE1562007.1 RimJ/RimL family protein N-acetyltransferase [Nonomuraea africana]
MNDVELDDGVVRLEPWGDGDAAWYAESVRDPLIQRFTSDSPTLDAAQVLAAINRLRRADDEEGFMICDAVSGARLGNIALKHDGQVGEVSYWLTAEARGRGAATRALTLFTSWIFSNVGLTELRLRTHRDNQASQHVALRVGYLRDPDRDGSQEAKGTVWPMLAFTLTRSTN